ncbi:MULTISPECIES: helix-turn-helix domain-containing protein [unclassified Streptomyces]|uniref:helix-turn-helix domain-containing protein n=1 Tax=unclassified Streptomyces TaxID=2593676 RepID=UPI000DD80F6F|nr:MULTISPECIES: helix-turn-helix domain-containing protein [unclassified Streptomyces]QZZ26536.1 helix-turn-helix domain-containing protein [Streptomyces sp. ST1015]
MPQPHSLITAADAAHYTGRAVGTIWRWASEGRISKYGHGKGVRYDVRELPGKTVDDVTGEVQLGDPPPLQQRLTGAA